MRLEWRQRGHHQGDEGQTVGSSSNIKEFGFYSEKPLQQRNKVGLTFLWIHSVAVL